MTSIFIWGIFCCAVFIALCLIICKVYSSWLNGRLMFNDKATSNGETNTPKFFVKSVSEVDLANGYSISRYEVECRIQCKSADCVKNTFIFYDAMNKFKVGDVLVLKVK